MGIMTKVANEPWAIGLAVAAVLALFLGVDAAARAGATADQAEAADAAELSVAALRAELDGFEPSLQLEAEAGRATARVNTLLDQELAFPVLLRRVAESMPEDTFLLSFRLSRDRASELSTGGSGSQPASLALTGVAGDLDGVGRWMQSVDEVTVVDGLWMTQSAAGPYGATDLVATVFTIEGDVVGRAEPLVLLGEAGTEQAGGASLDAGAERWNGAAYRIGGGPR
jgi:hypothetical protein